jgi:hypothetical protein
MGQVFAWAVGTSDAAAADPDAVAAGVRITFRASAALIVAAMAIVASARASTRRERANDIDLSTTHAH